MNPTAQDFLYITQHEVEIMHNSAKLILVHNSLHMTLMKYARNHLGIAMPIPRAEPEFMNRQDTRKIGKALMTFIEDRKYPRSIEGGILQLYDMFLHCEILEIIGDMTRMVYGEDSLDTPPTGKFIATRYLNERDIQSMRAQAKYTFPEELHLGHPHRTMLKARNPELLTAHKHTEDYYNTQKHRHWSWS